MFDRRAYTAIEILIVVAVILIAASLTSVAFRESRVVRAAQATSRRVALLRSTAILEGRSSTCLMQPTFGELVSASPPRGLLFTPDGLPRTCDGGGVGNTTILLEHRGRQAAVIVSSLGRVRWELR